MLRSKSQPIDAVYTWIDGCRSDFIAERDACVAEQQADSSLASRFVSTSAAPNRSRNWDELRYSLRSLDCYAPWLRRVYVVTKRGHIPEWIDQANPRLVFVFEDELLDPDLLPTFNSQTVEFHFNRIQGLADRFLNLNDDFFLMAPVTPEDFFGPEPFRDPPFGIPVHLDHLVASIPEMAQDNPLFLWGHTLRKTHDLLNACDDLEAADERLVPAHMPYPFYGPHLRTTSERFADAIADSNRYRLRHEETITLTFLHLHSLLSDPDVVAWPKDARDVGYRMISIGDDPADLEDALLPEALDGIRFLCLQDDAGPVYPHPAAPVLESFFERVLGSPSSFELPDASAAAMSALAREKHLAEAMWSAPSPAEDMIFVQIASYRDAECQWTVRDLFERASHPEKLRVGICWQVDPVLDTDCFRIETCPQWVRTNVVHYEASEGACWARSKVQTLWDGEGLTLQIDSHMRFDPGWDDSLRSFLELADSHRPILTTYPCHYAPPRELQGAQVLALEASRFRDGVLTVRSRSLPLGEHDRPIPSPFLSANFLFARSQVIDDAPYDPGLYFHGEEISLAARLWTHNWDLFAPHENVLYHRYGERGSRTHWNDHDAWWQRRNASFARVRQLLGHAEGIDDPDLAVGGKYGLGSARTLAEYEEFSGVNFAASTFERKERFD